MNDFLTSRIGLENNSQLKPRIVLKYEFRIHLIGPDLSVASARREPLLTKKSQRFVDVLVLSCTREQQFKRLFRMDRDVKMRVRSRVTKLEDGSLIETIAGSIFAYGWQGIQVMAALDGAGHFLKFLQSEYRNLEKDYQSRHMPPRHSSLEWKSNNLFAYLRSKGEMEVDVKVWDPRRSKDKLDGSLR